MVVSLFTTPHLSAHGSMVLLFPQLHSYSSMTRMHILPLQTVDVAEIFVSIVKSDAEAERCC